MSDNLKPEDRRKTMQSVKGKGTSVEKRLFGMLIRMKLKGWKKNVEYITGKPDAAFINQQTVIFVDGCFWHGCPRCRKKLPETNRGYWGKKIKRNIALATSHNRELRRAGWTTIRVWEHEFSNTAEIKNRILHALGNRT